MSRVEQIGFSQRVRLEWFEQTASLMLAGVEKEGINRELQGLLQDKLSVGGTAERGNREKVITILMKIWVTVPPEMVPLRDAGLQLLRSLPVEERMAVHWGMAMAVYPFWGAVAACVGRLLRLQGTAAAAHVQRRIRELFGERDTVSRAARRVLRTYVDWGVLTENGEKGVYGQGPKRTIEAQEVIVWLVEASLFGASNGSASLKAVLDAPSLFPFQIASVSADRIAAISKRFEVIRHGLEDDLVMLK